MNITEYYTTIDKNILNELCKNDYIKHLLELSMKTNLPVVHKKHKRWIIKDKHDIITQCQKRKKKVIKQTMTMLTNLAELCSAELCSTNTIIEMKKINHLLEEKINDIDMILEHINTSSDEEYIECYSNC